MISLSAQEQEEYDWRSFKEYAGSQGIILNDLDDYQVWWNCWKKGFTAGVARGITL